MMNKQKGDGAETPVTPGDARSWVGDLAVFHSTHVQGGSGNSATCAFLSVNLQSLQGKADWGEMPPVCLALSGDTSLCVATGMCRSPG